MAIETRNVDYESMVEKYTFGQQVEAVRNGINAYSGVKKVKSLFLTMWHNAYIYGHFKE